MYDVITIPLDAVADRVRVGLKNPSCFIAVLSADGSFSLALAESGALVSMEARGDALELCAPVTELYYTVATAGAVGDVATLLVSGNVNAKLV